nr:immunoglobulin superfamily containing leucine-rich repeat protein [Pelodiscus sinensis]|eukprot:XP_006121150.1 immunoglobulin superfamily containing leucine-rich repeat protein [Pelodiscus sinensis]
MAPFLCMWIAAFFGVSQGCPEPCTCVEKKFGRQLAECAYRDLQEVPAGLPSNVTTLTLSANRLHALQQRSFLEVTQVQSLWLAHNQISAIEAGTFAGLLHLKNIDLSHNQLADFPWRDLHNLSALQLLKMNNNQLASPPPELGWRVQTASQGTEVNGPSVERPRQDRAAGGSKQSAGSFVIFKNGTLLIPNFSKREEGTYTCLAANEVGADEVSASVALASSESLLEDLLRNKLAGAASKPGKPIPPRLQKSS